MVPPAGAYSPLVEALLAFAAALVALRLSGDLVGRYRARRRPELAAWAAGLAAYALAAGALAWGAAAGWSDAAFRAYYLGGGLLTAALLGAGSLLLVGHRWAARVAFLYAGLAIGVAIAAPLQIQLSGTEIPEAQDVLDVWPARILAILGNSLGPLRSSSSRSRRSARVRSATSSSWRASRLRRSGAGSRGSASAR